ncbi:zinc-ribbon domain-containing protein [Bosea sp. BIWAKO-01]|uniref:zinc-ribbon domain-containing protein n=1 Tax=Bosea sp. BIWAKO-01 TaxID=506668 RepID=UPI000852A154|nr:zinc-ribbon domain-containing protein [Bosea sp. BIWAKO-01]GAU82607.1 hypothetical protein BIWAKO_02528 [Bosea sp. BIWAKO-01]
MLIVCPSCSSQYELDAAKLGPSGRKVRCAKCETRWHVEAEPQPVTFPDAPSSEETTALLDEELRRATEIEEQVSALTAERAALAEGDEPSRPGARPRGRRPARTGRKPAPVPLGTRMRAMAAPALAIGGLAVLGLLVWQRDVAVRGAPQLAVVFEKIGLPVNVRGLSLTGIESGVVQDAQGRFLVVEGDVTNITKAVAKVPQIEVAVRDSAGQTLYTWATEPPRPTLEPSELIRFRARLAAPPEAGQSVLVRFTTAKSAGIASAH